MINKKLGVVFIILALVISVILYMMSGALRAEAEILGCYENIGCANIESSLTMTHFAFGIIGFLLSLGVYLLFFYTGEKQILEALKEQKERELKEQKFDIILSVLDPFESKILKDVKEQDGIGQRTLVIRTGFSKSKVSEVLKSLETKKLIKRVKKGKTNQVYCLK
ncbi:MAG: helix-turn-helix transcriptional regulator [Candidatus Woesearchaeota archaeon]